MKTPNLSILMIAVMMLFLHACASLKHGSKNKVVATLMNDGKTVVVTGCKDFPLLQQTLDATVPLLPEGTDKEALKAGVQIAEEYVPKACAVLVPALTK